MKRRMNNGHTWDRHELQNECCETCADTGTQLIISYLDADPEYGGRARYEEPATLAGAIRIAERAVVYTYVAVNCYCVEA